MCGIVGFINLSGSQSSKAEATFKELLFVDQIRGDDATGAAYLTEKGDVDWIKLASGPSEFFAHQDVSKYFGKANSSYAWVGHNRAGTVGKNINANAHPFQHDNIVGVHNGTIRNKYELCHEGWKFDVDSDAFFKGVQVHGLKETIKKTEGAFSVVYFDTDDKTVNFARNEQRPMHFLTVVEKGLNATTPDKEFLFFGSELFMLLWVCSRNGFICGDHIASKPLMHYKFHLGEAKPVVSALEPFVEKSYTHRYMGNTVVGGTGKHSSKASAVMALPSPRVNVDATTPYDLRKMSYWNNPQTKVQDKKTLERVFRSAVKGGEINFTISELVELGASYQTIGKLAGKRKRDLPVIISSLVDKKWLESNCDNAVYSGTVAHRRLTLDSKDIEIIVTDIKKLAFTQVEETV